MRYIILTFFVALFALEPAVANLKPYKAQQIMVPVGPERSLRRLVHIESAVPSDKVVIFLPGRASFFEKNLLMLKAIAGYESIHNEKIEVPCDVWSLDHAGHGMSAGRLGINDQRCHITDFDHYVREAEEVIQGTILKQYAGQNKKVYLVGSSMGGAVALRIVQDRLNAPIDGQDLHTPVQFHKVILIAPMIEFKTGMFPSWLARLLSYMATALGWGERYAFGFKDLDLTRADFSKFTGHHDESEFHQGNELLRNAPHLITSGPTFAWVNAAFQAVKKLQDFVAHYHNSQRHKPTIVGFIAGDDNLVHNAATIALLEGIGAVLYQYPTARHNLIKETPEHIPGFWQHFFDALTDKGAEREHQTMVSKSSSMPSNAAK
jgi:Lysophospholipase